MRIYVGNLSFDTGESQVEQLFASIGQVDSVGIIRDQATGRSRGFGFVEMATAEEGQKAIEQFNGKELNGRNLNVNEARPREDRGGNRGGFGGNRGGRGGSGGGRGGFSGNRSGGGGGGRGGYGGGSDRSPRW